MLNLAVNSLAVHLQLYIASKSAFYLLHSVKKRLATVLRAFLGLRVHPGSARGRVVRTWGQDMPGFVRGIRSPFDAFIIKNLA